MAGKRKYDGDTDLISLRVPSGLHETLKRRAIQEGRTKSEFVVRAIETALPDEPETGTIFD